MTKLKPSRAKVFSACRYALVIGWGVVAGYFSMMTYVLVTPLPGCLIALGAFILHHRHPIRVVLLSGTAAFGFFLYALGLPAPRLEDEDWPQGNTHRDEVRRMELMERRRTNSWLLTNIAFLSFVVMPPAAAWLTPRLLKGVMRWRA